MFFEDFSSSVYKIASCILGQLWLFPHGTTMDKNSLYMTHVSLFSFISVYLIYNTQMELDFKTLFMWLSW